MPSPVFPPAQGKSAHGEGCECTRCRGFEKGHEIRKTHGAHSSELALSEPAAEVSAVIRKAMIEESLYRPAFALTIHAASIAVVRTLRAERALEEFEARLAAGEESDPERHVYLESRTRHWLTALRGYLSDLGLSPASLARIQKDVGVGRAARASAALRDLDDHLESRYGEGDRNGGPEE